jgi:hypothetical protein
MPNGFVKFRRGLLDHLLEGRMSPDEYCVFSLLLQVADFRSGVWRGSGVALSTYLKTWSVRKCQRVLKSLARKAYVSLRSCRGKRGNYPVIIHKYGRKVTTRVSPVLKSDDTSDATLPKVTTPAYLSLRSTQEMGGVLCVGPTPKKTHDTTQKEKAKCARASQSTF